MTILHVKLLRINVENTSKYYFSEEWSLDLNSELLREISLSHSNCLIKII